MKSWTLMGIALLSGAIAPALADPVPRPVCVEWMHSIEWYSQRMEKAIGGGEVYDAYGKLEEAARHLVTDGDTKPLEDLETRCAMIVKKVREVKPPADFQSVHAKLDTFYESVRVAGATIHKRGLQPRDPALESCLSDLVVFYETTLNTFREHGCETGDTEALEEIILPPLRERLAQFQEN